MSANKITARCSRCFKRRVLRLAYTEDSAEWWFCRKCKADFDGEVANTKAAAHIARLFRSEP